MQTEIQPNIFLSDEEPESSYGIPVLVTHFPPEGRIARGPKDRMPWGETAQEWISNALGGGVEAWLNQACERLPQVQLFLRKS